MFKKDSHMGHLILECLKEQPDAICQIDAATGEEETNRSALIRSIHLARCFKKLGLTTGDVLALSGRNHLDQQVPYFAALMQGLPVTGIDATLKIDEIRSIFRIIEPKIAFCEPESYCDYVRASQDLGLTTKVFTFGNGENSMKELTETYRDDNPIEEFEAANFDKDDAYAWLVLSGGTTGVLKVAAVTHGAWIMKLESMLPHMSKNNNDKKTMINLPALNLSSVQWISWLFNAIGLPLLHQTKVQTSAPTTTEHVIDIINKYKPVTVLLSPSFASSLLKSDKPCDLSCFNSIFLSGGKVFKDTLIALKERMKKDALVLESYGQTENLGPVFPPNLKGPVGSCGKFYPGLQVKLVDPETGKEITEPNVPGELWTNGFRFSCYYNNPEETAKAFSEDGWYKTGDLLYRDEDDNYFFVDRLKMLIKYRNYQIVPPELEAVIRTHEDVLDVSVTSIPHEEDGEWPVACVVRRPGATVSAQEIKDLVADKLSEMKQIRGGVVFMDAIPLTPVGKVARAHLRKMVLNMPRE